MWTAEAPSNIALIKYMGKIEGQGNRPTNSSISYTLNHLRTRVDILATSKTQWEPLNEGGFSAPELSDKGKKRFIDHFERLKQAWGIEGEFTIRSGNNFPSDCGLASSASSFAALTKAAWSVAQTEGAKKIDLTQSELADWSRQGSGSSCRSLFSPWAIWSSTGEIYQANCAYEDLYHAVVIANEELKAVSSSQAHIRVQSSELFHGRPDRAERRQKSLIESLAENSKTAWSKAFELCWAEFWDMHALFETSIPSFGYMTAESLRATAGARNQWKQAGDGPLVTMDAGPNVHLLYRKDQMDLAKALVEDLRKEFKIMTSWEKSANEF